MTDKIWERSKVTPNAPPTIPLFSENRNEYTTEGNIFLEFNGFKEASYLREHYGIKGFQ
jgi:hypothetical protein